MKCGGVKTFKFGTKSSFRYILLKDHFEPIVKAIYTLKI